jgi:DNA-binding transcriptional LysR family regulator
MPTDHLKDLQAFLAVARERSFSRAAAKMGVSSSALSHAVRRLEEKHKVRLLSRTTRSVAPTAIGEALIRSIGPHFEGIETELAGLNRFRDRPAGRIRISCVDSMIEGIFRPVLREFLREYPDVAVEFVMDNALVDIVADRFDAGVRLGESISKDMIAVRIGPDFRFTCVATPDYLANRTIPQAPQDLVAHQCINLHLPTAGSHYAWEFGKGDKRVNVKVEGQLTFNSVIPILGAALDGHGVAFLPENMTNDYIKNGQLIEVLEDWSIVWQGHHLYYPNRRLTSPAFTAFIDAIRYRS